jgi:hypothetical protein
VSRPAVVAVLVLALASAAPAPADEPEEVENQPARAFAIQALAIIEQGGSHEEAMEKLEHALEAEDTEGVNPDALETALTALEEERPDDAERLLLAAFTDENVHVVGVTVRLGSETARLAAGIAGGVVLGIAVAGLVRRRRVDRRFAA